MSLKSNKLYSFKLYLEIQKINPEAAEYFWFMVMKEEMWGRSLSGVFTWSATEQGSAFWNTIDKQVRYLVKRENPWEESR